MFGVVICFFGLATCAGTSKSIQGLMGMQTVASFRGSRIFRPVCTYRIVFEPPGLAESFLHVLERLEVIRVFHVLYLGLLAVLFVVDVDL